MSRTMPWAPSKDEAVVFESAQEREEAFHKAFEAVYARQTVLGAGVKELEDDLASLHSFVDASHNGCFGSKRNVLIVASDPGLGKSTLLTSFIKDRRQRKNYGEYVLGHYASCSRSARSLLGFMTRWVWHFGMRLGRDVTEWHKANRGSLEALISGEMSEQTVMATLKRYLSSLLKKPAVHEKIKGNQISSPPPTTECEPVKGIILVVDAADTIVDAQGATALHWLPEILPEGSSIILSVTSPSEDPLKIKRSHLARSYESFPRELATSEDPSIQHMMSRIRSLAQYETLSINSLRIYPVLRESFRRRYYILELKTLRAESQIAIARGALARRAAEARQLLESTPQLNVVIKQAPEDMNMREDIEDLIQCIASFEEEQSSSNQQKSTDLSNSVVSNDSDDDGEDDNNNHRRSLDELGNSVSCMSNPTILCGVLKIMMEACPLEGAAVRATVECLEAVYKRSRDNTKKPGSAIETVLEHVYSNLDAAFEYAKLMIDSDGFLLRPSTTTGHANGATSLFRFVVSVLGNSRFGASRSELLGILKCSLEARAKIEGLSVSLCSGTLRSYVLWLLRDEIMLVKRDKAGLLKPKRVKLSRQSSISKLGPLRGSIDQTDDDLNWAGRPMSPAGKLSILRLAQFEDRAYNVSIECNSIEDEPLKPASVEFLSFYTSFSLYSVAVGHRELNYNSQESSKTKISKTLHESVHIRRAQAAYYEGLDACQRQIEELPPHYVWLNKWIDLKNVLTSPPSFEVFWRGHGGVNRSDLLYYWTTKVEKHGKVDPRLCTVFNVVEEYVDGIDTWTHRNIQSGMSGTFQSTIKESMPFTKKKHKRKTARNAGQQRTATYQSHEYNSRELRTEIIDSKQQAVQFLIADVTAFLELCTRCSDDIVFSPTRIVLPYFHRQMPPCLNAITDTIHKSVEVSLPRTILQYLKSEDESKLNMQLYHQGVLGGVDNLLNLSASIHRTNQSLLSVRVMQRLDKLHIFRTPHGSNFNKMASYWLSRWNWVQLPILIIQRISNILHQSGKRLSIMVNRMESANHPQKLRSSPVKSRHRRGGVSLEGRRRRVSHVKSINKKTHMKSDHLSQKKNEKLKSVVTTPMRKSASAPMPVFLQHRGKNSVLNFSPRGRVIMDPFRALNVALSRNNASKTEQIAEMRRNIMMQKHELNQLVVARRKLQEKNRQYKNTVSRCRLVIKETETLLERDKRNSSGPSLNDSVEKMCVLVQKLLLQQLLHQYLAQVRHVCDTFTGEDLGIVNATMENIEKLQKQTESAKSNLRRVKNKIRRYEITLIPSFESSLGRFQKLKEATLKELQRGADALARNELAQIAEKQRQTDIRENVRSEASAKEQERSRRTTTNALMRALGLRDKKNFFKSGTRAMSYKKAGEKLHSIGIDEPMDIIDRITVQHATWKDLDSQVQEAEKEKALKVTELQELNSILSGDNTHKVDSAPMVKIDEIESLISRADKSLNRSRDKLASSLLLTSAAKAGLVHLTDLLGMKKAKDALLSQSSFSGSANSEYEHDVQSKRVQASTWKNIKYALNSIEDRLGQMVDVLDIVEQSRRKSSNRRLSVSTSGTKQRKSSSSYWNPSSDPELVPSQNNLRPVGTPEVGSNGIVEPRRPISRIIAIRRNNFDKHGSYPASPVTGVEATSGAEGNIKDEEEDAWFARTKEEARVKRIKEERRRRQAIEMERKRKETHRENLRMEERMKAEAEANAKRELVELRKAKAAQKKEQLIHQQIKKSEEAAERKRQRLQKKRLRRPLWKRKK